MSATSKRQRTQGRILSAARTLFSERGYDATTVRGIASLANVSAATVILYGDSKEALFESLYLTEVDRLLEDALASTPPPAPLPIQLTHVFTPLIRYFAQEPAAGRVLLRLRLFDDTTTRGAALQNGIRALVQRAQQTGRVRSDLDPDLVTTAAIHIYSGCLAEMLRAKVPSVETPQQPTPHEPHDPTATLQRLSFMLRLLEEGTSPWR